MYGTEQINEQWQRETAAEYFDRTGDYDGTERKDEKQVPTLDEFNDTADSDRYDLENTQHETVIDAILAAFENCENEQEEKYTTKILSNYFLNIGYFYHIVTEATTEAEKIFSNLKNTPN